MVKDTLSTTSNSSNTHPFTPVEKDTSSLFLQALKCQPVERTPVWLMRQAGRYMPEYRKLRSQVKDFIVLCQNPELACEVTMMPLRRYRLDAAIIFSDILLIGQAMGLPLSFQEGEGPVFAPRIESLKQVEQLETNEAADKLSFVSDAIKLVVKELNNIPLIGFCGSPWTVATYMVEGGTSKDFSKIKTLAWQQPETVELLLDKLSETTIKYLKAQVKAGVKALMIFDTWGGILSDHAYKRFSLAAVQKIVKALKADEATKSTPIIFFAKGKYTLFSDLVALGIEGLSIDWTVDLGWVREQVGQKIALQGNLDPTLLMATPDMLQQEVARVIQSHGKQPGHIFNLGHGILPQTPPEQVERLIEWVEMYSLRT
ncbi:uroporphyrinogen decarboxylase [Candidatus Berkiella cookevillensis]|uniref:Uroporphyrinogen decarboxylase n=1 Tax=Candidatus Berkiella cookevillensis TaxID=437022 RepID=A0A0Q9YLI4_9GAMM|nr:uroporphyrinogen decarboxylase [Candidatus Berkiella cookevillensis]MCS5709580.1 uroporphyrinogen decarboxylase [Candidatus Berkiella cookevillensis]